MDTAKNTPSGQISSLDPYVSGQLHDHCLYFGALQCLNKFVPVLNNFFGVPDALISFILKFYPLSRVSFLCWEANLPSNCVNLSQVNFKIIH